MLRAFLIYLSKANWAQRLVTSRHFAWKAAKRFVPGTRAEDAIQAARDLSAKGINTSLNHLGESTASREDALKAMDEILALIDKIEVEIVRANVSIKLTQIGLAWDESFCEENLEKILNRAHRSGNFVRIDMEDSPYTEKTIRLYRQMRKRGFDNVGLVIQAYLYRSEKDIRELVDEGACVRLVKGTYRESADLAYPKKSDVNSNYDHLAQLLIDGALANHSTEASKDGRIPPLPAIASHDESRLNHAKDYADGIGLSRKAIEFQMIYGIRRDLQEKLSGEGYQVRVYVPYGIHWYPYFMRRLAERPANLWFFLSNLFRK